ncbi:AI-2E family transporter [Leptolyngbya sp. FACHB-321]|uniref:AI-2E family transporter n=1 Tax=Leptolyngbya sp. FACHB-321 TaxID=2692807 RepID=UPI001687BC11|nr:AI-2E family transporter [Leptolyngbya sp. FACHB-321]MBD2034691.1 AI-2E family transporter [Leptolyngbya sp. FACHB-321]
MLGSDQWTQWLKIRLTLPFIVLNGWVLLQLVQYFEPLFTILILSAVLAYVLNYPVQFLYRSGLRRRYAVLLVLVVSLVILITLGVTLFPTVVTQLNEIVTLLPDWIAALSQKLEVLQAWALSRRLPIHLNRLIAQFSDRLPGELQALADQSVTLTLDAIGSLSEALLVIVLTLYLLLDGRRVWDGFFQWVPQKYRDRSAQQLESNFNRYFIGQATMGLIMGTALTLAFFFLNVPYSLLLGLLVGLMTLIPFGDVLSFGLISLLVAAQDLGLGVKTLAVAATIDQIVDQAIAPRVLGGFTGLRPIWVIISLLIGTKIAGLPGLLTAVPVAGFIQDLIEDRQHSAVESVTPESPSESAIVNQASHSTVSQDPIQSVAESPS